MVLKVKTMKNITNANKFEAFKRIQDTNPAYDSYHTHIRSAEEVKTLEEVYNDPSASEFWDMYSGDNLNPETISDAIKSNFITVYHGNSRNGVGCFVTTSKTEAYIYGGGDFHGFGEYYRATIPINWIAWISVFEGIALNPIKWERVREVPEI